MGLTPDQLNQNLELDLGKRWEVSEGVLEKASCFFSCWHSVFFVVVAELPNDALGTD